jgi:GTP cyclohydrolase I
VVVVVEGAHLCSTMRGVRKADARMVSSAVLGGFKTDAHTHNEFFEHIRKTASS